MNSTVSPSRYFCMDHQSLIAPRLTSAVGNVKIALSEISYYCCIHMPMFRIVWLLRNLRLDGKLCLDIDKNAAFD